MMLAIASDIHVGVHNPGCTATCCCPHVGRQACCWCLPPCRRQAHLLHHNAYNAPPPDPTLSPLEPPPPPPPLPCRPPCPLSPPPSTPLQACGLHFGVAPFVSRRAYGVVSGLIGAGGNTGAAVTQALFFAGKEQWQLL